MGGGVEIETEAVRASWSLFRRASMKEMSDSDNVELNDMRGY
jgi:hypothetical protein